MAPIINKHVLIISKYSLVSDRALDETLAKNGGPSRNKYRAIQLSVPTVIAHLKVEHRDPEDNVLDSREYNIDLNSGQCLQYYQPSMNSPTQYFFFIS